MKLDWEELKKEVQFNLSTNEKKLSQLLADHFTKCEGPDNYGVMRIQDTRYPKLSFKPHTVQRIRASEDIPFLSVRHPEVSNILKKIKEAPIENSYIYELDLDNKIIQDLNLERNKIYTLSAHLWDISGVTNYSRIELVISDGFHSRYHPKLRDVVECFLKELQKDKCQLLDIGEKTKDELKTIEDDIKAQRDKQSERIFNDRVLQKQKASEDQKEAKRLLEEERETIDKDFNLSILKAPMSEKSKLLRQKERKLKDLDKELHIYRQAIQDLSKAESELQTDIIRQHEKGHIQHKILFNSSFSLASPKKL